MFLRLPIVECSENYWVPLKPHSEIPPEFWPNSPCFLQPFSGCPRHFSTGHWKGFLSPPLEMNKWQFTVLGGCRDSRLSSKAASLLCLSVAFEHWRCITFWRPSLPKKLLVASHPLQRAAILVFFFFSSPLLSSHSVVIISMKYHHSVRLLWSL